MYIKDFYIFCNRRRRRHTATVAIFFSFVRLSRSLFVFGLLSLAHGYILYARGSRHTQTKSLPSNWLVLVLRIVLLLLLFSSSWLSIVWCWYLARFPRCDYSFGFCFETTVPDFWVRAWWVSFQLTTETVVARRALYLGGSLPHTVTLQSQKWMKIPQNTIQRTGTPANWKTPLLLSFYPVFISYRGR